MADVKSRMVMVRCAVRAGLMLVLYEKVDVGAGMFQYRPQRGSAPVTIPFGDLQIDEEFIDAWLNQQAESALVKEGFVKKWPPQQP